MNFLPLGHLNFTVRSRHSLSEVFFAENSWERLESSTFLLGADPKLSGEGVFNGIYHCPLGSRATCTCMLLCTGLVILTPWLRASNLSIVNRCLQCSMQLILLEILLISLLFFSIHVFNYYYSIFNFIFMISAINFIW